MPEARGNPQPAAVVLDQAISWNRIQWYWLWRSPDRFTLRAENYSCLQTARIQPLFQPTFLWFYHPQAKFHHHMFGGWWWFPQFSYFDLQSDVFCALCLHWNQRWTDKKKKTWEKERQIRGNPQPAVVVSGSGYILEHNTGTLAVTEPR